jgi:hypothetical protein
MAGVASMAAAISVADRSLPLVIRFSIWIRKANNLALYAGGEAIGRLKEHLLTRYQHRARSTFKNQFEFINRFLIEKIALGRDVSKRLPELRCAAGSSVGRPFQEDNRGNSSWAEGSYRRAAACHVRR